MYFITDKLYKEFLNHNKDLTTKHFIRKFHFRFKGFYKVSTYKKLYAANWLLSIIIAQNIEVLANSITLSYASNTRWLQLKHPYSDLPIYWTVTQCKGSKFCVPTIQDIGKRATQKTT